MAEQLPSAPLVEAILELHWKMSPHPVTQVTVDPHFKFLLGRFQQAIETNYPAVEALPTATLPEEFADRQVQFRFRTEQGKWPLLQLGPGVLTLNHTRGYDWDDFRERAMTAIEAVASSHPEPESLRFERISLRFINADDFQWRNENIFDYLREQMKLSMSLSPGFFGADIASRPTGFRCQFAFPCSAPEGRFEFTAGFGTRNDHEVLLWEMKMESSVTGYLTHQFADWLNDSHAVIEAWFFKMVDGSLLARYSNEPARAT